MQRQIPFQVLMKILKMDYINIPVDLSNYEEAVKQLEFFKKEVKKQRNKLAKMYHPDKPGGDHDKMQQINRAYELIMKLKIKRQPPVRTMVWSTVNSSTTGRTTTTIFKYYRTMY